MKCRTNRLKFLVVPVVLCIWIAVNLQTTGQTVQGLNFKVAEFYEAPHQAQMKFLLEGAKAVQQGKNRVLVTQPKCQTYRMTGEQEFIIAAPECVYESSKRSISSSGPLKVQTAENKFAIEGVGFSWEQTNSSLFISNQVRTTIDSDLLKSTTNNPSLLKADGQGLQVTSDQFLYAADTGVAIYREHVHVTGTNLALNCELLIVRLPFREHQLQSITASNQVSVEYGDIQARSQAATYSPAQDSVQLSGAPEWQVGTRGGSADELILERTNQVLKALGHATLHLPGHTLEMSSLLPASTNTTQRSSQESQVLDITADNYELRTNSAVFIGGVRTTQHSGENLSGRLSCQTMTIVLAGTNQLESLNAMENVEIEHGDQGFKAGRADYKGASGVLELSENPKWFAGTSAGSGDQISVTQTAMEVKGNARMTLPANQLKPMGVGTNLHALKGPSTDKQMAQIRSRDYRLTKDRAQFQGDVHIDHPQMQWNCDSVTLNFPKQGEVDRVLAENNVTFDLMDPQGHKIRGTGQQALFTHKVTASATNDLVELSGNPVLVTSYGTFKNKVILFDLAQNKLIARGNYQVIAGAAATPTNQFIIPKLKITR